MALPDLKWLDLPGGRVAYRRAGAGAPLLLIHGWGVSSSCWAGAFESFAERHDVIAVDLPGFGASPPPHGPAGLVDQAQIALDAADALRLGSFNLGGHSFGAAVALLLAAAHPDRVERLALASFGLPHTPEEELRAAALHWQLALGLVFWSPWLTFWSPLLTLLRPWNRLFWTTPPLPIMLADLAMYDSARVPYATIVAGVTDTASMNARVAVETASSSGDPVVVRVAGRVRAPAMVLNGRQDGLFPASSAVVLARAMPGAGLTLFDACGHIPMLEQPAAFYGALDSFLAKRN